MADMSPNSLPKDAAPVAQAPCAAPDLIDLPARLYYCLKDLQAEKRLQWPAPSSASSETTI